MVYEPSDTANRRNCESTTSSTTGSSPSEQTSTQSLVEVSTPTSACTTNRPSGTLALFAGLTTLEADVLRTCFGAQGAAGRYTIGPSFHDRHQRALMTQLYSALPQLKDGFLSCAPVLASQQNVLLPENMEKFCYSKAATAISSLRALHVHDRFDVSISLALGITILTFGLCVSGGETFTLARYTLGLIKPYYETNCLFDDDETSYLICLVLAETIGCLYRGEVPTLKYQCNAMQHGVDRFLGVSYPLLAPLYDLCDINHKFCHRKAADGHKTTEDLSAVEAAVQSWQPGFPIHFSEVYDQDEMVNIRAQAKGLRLAILLIAHRLKYPYGTQDDRAMLLAGLITAEVDQAMQITEHPVKCTDLCLMTASLECVDDATRLKALDMVDRLLNFSGRFRAMIKQRLKTFWAARDEGNKIYWFDLNHYWHGSPAH